MNEKKDLKILTLLSAIALLIAAVMLSITFFSPEKNFAIELIGAIALFLGGILLLIDALVRILQKRKKSPQDEFDKNRKQE